MSDEKVVPIPFKEHSLYDGMAIRRYEYGDIEYEIEGLRDSYGSEHRMNFVVSRDRNVILSFGRADNPPLQMQFNAEKSSTPNMAQRFTRIARALFENGGERLDDEADFKVSSRHENLKILREGNSLNDIHIMGITGDGIGTERMNLTVGRYADLTIELLQLPEGDLDYKLLSLIYAASGTGRFHQAVLHELREATREIARSVE